MIRLRRVPAAFASLSIALSGSVTVSAQQDRQIFDLPATLLPAGQYYDALLDLDGDGFQDSLGVSYVPHVTGGGHYQVHGRVNDGAGVLVPTFVFDWTATYSVDEYLPRRVVRADFDGDNRDDFAVLVMGRIGVFTSNGAALPSLVATLPSSGGPIPEFQMTVADFDGNGIDDVAVRRGDDLRVFDMVTTATPTSSVLISTPIEGVFSNGNQGLLAIDVTGDSLPELMTGGMGGVATVSTYSYSPGALASLSSWSLGLNSVPLLVAGDVDGDSDTDIVAFSREGNYQIMRRTSVTGFSVEPMLAAPPAQRLIDVDFDGDLDAAGADIYYDWSGLAPFSISKNADGLGHFGSAMSWPTRGEHSNFAGAVDLEHDGDIDFAFDDYVFYARGPWEAPPAGFETPPGLPDVTRTTIADIDGDGDPDGWSRPSTYVRNMGDGATQSVTRPTPPLPPGTSFTAAGYSGDLDQDGDLDLVVHHLTNGSGTPISERLLRNNGAGGLSDGGPITAPGTLLLAGNPLGDVDESAVTFVDIDNDGDVDAIASWLINANQGSTIVHRNTNGIFAPTQSFSLGVTNRDRIADIDGDGFVDLVMALDSDLGGMSFHWGGPGGVFGPDVFPPLTGQQTDWITYVYCSDLDGDGDLDIVFENNYSNDYFVNVLENVGSRSFVLRNDLLASTTGGSNRRLLVGDVDLDSHVDILLAGEAFNERTSVWFGSAAPGFDLTFGGMYWTVTKRLADIDGDGDPDSIGDSLRRNQTRLPETHGHRRQFGDATAGAFGQQPSLGASGDLRVGHVAEIRVSGTPPGAPSVIFVGPIAAPNPPAVLGGVLHVYPFALGVSLVVPGNAAEFASGKLTIPFTVSLGASFASWYFQLAAMDASSPTGVIWTNALELEFGS